MIRPSYALVSSTGLSNLVFYPAVLVGLIPSYAPPLTGLIGIWTIRARETPAAQYTLALIVLTLAAFSVYFFQAVRFMAPIATLLLVYGATGMTRCATTLVTRNAAWSAIRPSRC